MSGRVPLLYSCWGDACGRLTGGNETMGAEGRLIDAPGTSDALPDDDMLRSSVASTALNSRLDVVNSVSLYSAGMITQVSKIIKTVLSVYD